MNEELEMTKEIETIYPTVALRGMTILPGMIIHFDVSRGKSIEAVQQAMLTDQKLLVVAQKNPDVENPSFEDVYQVGTVTKVRQMTKLPNDVVRVLVEGQNRAVLQEFVSNDAYIMTKVSCTYEEESEDEAMGRTEYNAMTAIVKETFSAYYTFYPQIGKAVKDQLEESMTLGRLLDCITINIPLDFRKKQQVLDAVDVKERFKVLTGILAGEVETVKIKNQLAMEVKQRIEKNQKDYMLREQLQFIKEELGEDNTDSDIRQFEEALQRLKAKKEVKDKIRKAISRYQNVAASHSEGAIERVYVETLLELPWDKASKDDNDLCNAEEKLNEDHYGLDKVKERVLEYLAVRMLNGKGNTPILCLVGPPGTGKTSIARSIADALHKKYVRICLGGVRDEAEIRGHRKTYVGAMPGRIASALKQAGVKNPLMLLDEIDKLGNDYKGDPSAALLEVLDSEQNHAFLDHYVEIPIDLSGVLFVATANTTDTIPKPLLDRMEIIEVTSYTANEKFQIAKRHLVNKQLEKNGIPFDRIEITDDALQDIIRFYTREAGVRNLERQLGTICRKYARELFMEQSGKKTIKSKMTRKVIVNTKDLEKYLGKPKYRDEKPYKKKEIGIVRGLAWTSVGGDTLQIEVNKMPGEGKIDLTGQMGDVMKESARIAMSYVRSVAGQYQISPEVFKENDFHIHIPEGAVPKDGPSAGVTMATAILSAVTDKPVRYDVAMTGEITLRGKALPVGGLKEKVLAAKMAGMKKVLIPKDNKKDIEEIPDEIKKGLQICFVEDMEEIVKHALTR